MEEEEFVLEIGLTETDVRLSLSDFEEVPSSVKVVLPNADKFREFYKELPLPVLNLVFDLDFVDEVGINNISLESESEINGVPSEGFIFRLDFEVPEGAFNFMGSARTSRLSGIGWFGEGVKVVPAE